MEMTRLKKIIEYSESHGSDIEAKVREFYLRIGMENAATFCNAIQIIRPLFLEQNFVIVELPFSDKEIGALCYKGDAMGYTFLNTSLPKANVNFALCHEIYHLFYHRIGSGKKIELYLNEHYYEHEEEFAANLFAGMLLMPEQSYRFMYQKFCSEATQRDNQLSILVKLMSYFKVPYMAALIRCYELKLMDSGRTLEKMLHISREEVRQEFSRLWLDEDILQPTKKDDFNKFEMLVKYVGEEYCEGGYLKKNEVEKALRNMKALYKKIREER